MSRRQRQAIAFMTAIHRNHVSRSAEGNTSAGHSGRKSGNGEETNHNNGGNSGGGLAAHTHRRANRVHIPLPQRGEVTIVGLRRSIARWLTQLSISVTTLYDGIDERLTVGISGPRLVNRPQRRPIKSSSDVPSINPPFRWACHAPQVPVTQSTFGTWGAQGGSGDDWPPRRSTAVVRLLGFF
jgi:hypothetical protein